MDLMIGLLSQCAGLDGGGRSGLFFKGSEGGKSGSGGDVHTTKHMCLCMTVSSIFEKKIVSSCMQRINIHMGTY